MTTKYSIGIDFGTLSGRTVLVDLDDRKELDVEICNYPHAVMESQLPSGLKLPADFALQHPDDYLHAIKHTVPELLKRNNISPDQIIGIGIDFTACTMMCVDKEGTPLCFKEEYSDNPYAYVKLWKHHAAQKQADKINKTARDMGCKWLERYGGKISSEWFFPKILETLENAYDVYENTYRFIEAGDWVVWMLTGNETHNACMAGYKAMWHKKDGYPKKEFFKALDPRMENIIGTKVSDKVLPMAPKAGGLNKYGSALTGC